jgi:hypothetical protein
MRSLEQLDSWMAAKVKIWSSRVSGAPQSRELLEIRRDILGHVRDHIQPKGQGKSIFPYNAISIRIAAQTKEQQKLYEAAFHEGNALEEEIRELLSQAGCPLPSGPHVAVSVIRDAALASTSRPFLIDYSKTKAAVSKLVRNPRPNAKLTILRGEADVTEYTIHSDRVNIGRLREVIGDKQGLRRRNDIAFADTEATVSREHAYIRYDQQAGKFRLYDSLSQRGTCVFRDGRRFEVPRGLVHGFQLKSGDEIHVGNARIGFETEPEA